MTYKNYLILILTMIISVPAFATQLFAPIPKLKGDYQCYAGMLSHPEINGITEIRFALQKGTHYPSVLAFYRNKTTYYSSDVFCNAIRTGHCVIVDDRGSFEIMTVTNQKMLIQFNGKPTIASMNGTEAAPKKGTEVFPSVSNANLKSPVQVTLTIRPQSYCHY